MFFTQGLTKVSMVRTGDEYKRVEKSVSIK